MWTQVGISVERGGDKHGGQDDVQSVAGCFESLSYWVIAGVWMGSRTECG